MVKSSDECWLVAIRLPNGLIFDGGLGVHDEIMYNDKFDIIDRFDYDLELLETFRWVKKELSTLLSQFFH